MCDVSDCLCVLSVLSKLIHVSDFFVDKFDTCLTACVIVDVLLMLDCDT